MCLLHLSRIITFNDTVEWPGVFTDNSFTYTEGTLRSRKTLSGKAECEAT